MTEFVEWDPYGVKDGAVLTNLQGVDRVSMMVCSNRAMAFIRDRAPEAVEYLPVTLFDHKQKALPDPHWIVHPIDPPDCIDFANSKVTWSSLDPNSIQRYRHLELDPSRVPATRQIFRPKSCPGLLALRRTLAEQLVQQGFTGARWKEIK